MKMKNSDKQTIKSLNMRNKSKTLSNIENAARQKLPYPKRQFCRFISQINWVILKMMQPCYFTYSSWSYILCVFLEASCLTFGWANSTQILYLSIIYSIGTVIVSVGSIPIIDFSSKLSLYIGLLLIAFSSGGIKPCVSAFGGDQFKMPEQAAQLASFFSLFYFSINAGSLISTIITPMLRADVHCFGDKDCFPLAFGVPAMLMVVSLFLFFVGKPSYTIDKTSEENMIIRMFKCIMNAITTKYRERKTKPRDNLLDYSIDKFGVQLVSDTRIMLKILLLYLPLPLFWALFGQQSTRWTFQANKMNGDLGFYIIKPDQVQMMNPLMILAFIPILEAVLYPLLNKIGIGRPLQRLALGGISAGLSFLLSAFVEFSIEASPEKSVSMLWQIPQYVVITIGEVMFSVTGLSFSYNEAPESMKSVVKAFWLLTVTFGNVIFVIVAESEIFESQAYEFILFAGLMFVDMFVFVVIANFYESGATVKLDNSEENEKIEQRENRFDEKSSF